MSKTTEQQLEEKEEFLHLLHQVVQHTPLKLEETSGTEYDKGYIFYQDMVLRDVEELETTMWEWHQKKCQERDRIAYKQGYNAGLSDGTDKPLLAIEHIQEQAREEEREKFLEILQKLYQAGDDRKERTMQYWQKIKALTTSLEDPN